MPKEFLIPVEEELINWANGKDYIIQERIWTGQREQEHLLHRELNPIEPTESRLLKDAVEVAAIETAYFTRDVYTPNGVITYRLGHLDFFHSINSEEELKSLLDSQRPYFHELRTTLRLPLKNWRSEDYSLSQRQSDGLLYLCLILYSKGAHAPSNIRMRPTQRMQEEYTNTSFFKIWRTTALLGKRESKVENSNQTLIFFDQHRANPSAFFQYIDRFITSFSE